MSFTPRLPAARASQIVPLALLTALGVSAPAPAQASSAPRGASTLAKPDASPVVLTTAAAPVRAGSYTVRSGDTLSHVGARFGVTVAALQRANGLGSSTLIRTGQRLNVPTSSSGTTSTGSSSTKSSGSVRSGRTYTVRSGDTLSSIAAANGTSLRSVVAVNPGISANNLQVGQKISLPAGSSGSSNSFAGRTYPKATVDAADANRSTLSTRANPSRATMQQLVRDTARRYGVNVALAQAIAFQESGFRMTAVSPANAVGTMQVIPSAGAWASQLAGRKLNLLDPQDNVTAGVLILRANLRAAGDEPTAIAAYYQGLSSVRANGMFTDTKAYVRAIQAHKARFS